jgi:hypothetical protein
MKDRFAAMSVCLCVAAAFALTIGVGAQGSQPEQKEKTRDVSLTGCLVQGSGPNAFLLENAKTDPGDSNEMGRSYLLATDDSSISFRDHLNHEVRIDGTAETKMPPEGQKVKESDLPKLTARGLTHVATTCGEPPI